MKGNKYSHYLSILTHILYFRLYLFSFHLFQNQITTQILKPKLLNLITHWDNNKPAKKSKIKKLKNTNFVITDKKIDDLEKIFNLSLKSVKNNQLKTIYSYQTKFRNTTVDGVKYIHSFITKQPNNRQILVQISE